MFCLLDVAYRGVAGLPEEGSWRIPNAMKDELLALSILAPFLFTNLMIFLQVFICFLLVSDKNTLPLLSPHMWDQ